MPFDPCDFPDPTLEPEPEWVQMDSLVRLVCRMNLLETKETPTLEGQGLQGTNRGE